MSGFLLAKGVLITVGLIVVTLLICALDNHYLRKERKEKENGETH